AALRAATEMAAPNECGAARGTPGRDDLLAPDIFRHFFEGREALQVGSSWRRVRRPLREARGDLAGQALVVGERVLLAAAEVLQLHHALGQLVGAEHE